MIEEQTIDGERVLVAYLDEQLQPAEKDEADFAKMLWDDGRMLILALKEQPVG